MRNPLNTTAQIRIVIAPRNPLERPRTISFEVRPWVWVIAIVGGFVTGYILSCVS